MKKSLLLLIFIYLFFPLDSFANIEITEIMYDQEGTDTDYEWVEIYNTGNDIDISEWHFYENDVHHGLAPDGFMTLESGERALIVQNIEIMRSELGNTLNLIKSSFSLNNTGEELAMSDIDKLIHTSATYSSDDGGMGNGYSLQKSGNNWIQAEPTPGKINSTTNQSSLNNASITENVVNNLVEKSSVTKKQDFYTGFIEVLDQPIARSEIQIEAYVTHTKNSKVTKKIKGGIYFVNFGDGSFLELDERIDVQHIYEYPGSYEIVFEFFPSRLTKEYDRDSKVITRRKITVVEPIITIADIDDRGAIILENNGDTEIDISEWNIYNTKNNQEYVFPKYSKIYAKQKVHIPKGIHNLGIINYDTWVTLRNKNTITISSYTKNKSKLDRLGNTTQHKKDELKIPSSQEEIVEGSTEIEKTPLALFLEQHPNKELADFGNDSYGNRSSKESATISFLPTIITAIIAMVLAVIRLFYKHKNEDSTVDNVIGEIELIE